MSQEQETVNEVAEATLEEQVSSRKAKGSKSSKKGKTAKKAAATSAKTKQPKVAKEKDGVIKHIVESLTQDGGATLEDIVKNLTKNFPDRKEEGMKTTARIQITRLPKRFEFEMKKKKNDDGKLVYSAPKSLMNKYLKGKTAESAA